ncbi:hypothetical protein PHLCEN_2v9680 [Hermanssonia centrifuga]|uniref:Uncharacterized protein n=1 Tax=Hermanssonia centrifuga TaxID=98765 RepID=A0A2R6NQ24_9APHY|nr:hypothetical protein PHLCEN_2v9680 [Hermanssonia centrifuga]
MTVSIFFQRHNRKPRLTAENTRLWTDYSQCIPGTASSASTVAPPVTPPPATTTSVVSSPPTTPPPTTTSSGATPTGSQLRTDDDPVYHFYLQSNDGAVMLGPEASSGYFTISNTISLNNPDGSELYLNLDTSATTSYVPLSFDPTATTTDWALEGDTIITSDPRQLNFLVCATSDPNFYSVYLQNGNDQPAGATCTYQPVPTDLDDTDRTQPDKTRRNIPYFRKLVLLTLGFCLVALVSYKAGQWSAQPQFEENQTPAVPEQEQEEEISVSPTTPANDTDMPGNGKYSVG